MAKYRPIVYDYIENGRASLEDQVRAYVREHPAAVRPSVATPSPLAGAMAGFKARGGTSIRGGTFSPGPTSGML